MPSPARSSPSLISGIPARRSGPGRGYLWIVDQSEFARRIKVYVERDLPGVDADRVAASLAPALFQYVRREQAPASGRSAFLEGFVPRNALVLFTAAWDGNSQRYRPELLWADERRIDNGTLQSSMGRRRGNSE